MEKEEKIISISSTSEPSNTVVVSSENIDKDEFFNAWHFVEDHPYFKYKLYPEQKYEDSCFLLGLHIMVVKVNPKTNYIDDDESKNTETRVWLECGSWNDETKSCYHDIRLDCGGMTFESAIIELAKLLDRGEHLKKLEV